MTAKEKKKRLILLDAHAILHRAYHALPDFSTRDGRPTGALYGLATMLIRIIDEFNPDYLIACFDLPGPTHRHDHYKEYKATRKKADEELVDQIIRSRDLVSAFGIPYYEEKGYEADDLLGTITETLKKHDDLEIIIASGDMDTLQLVDDKRVQVYTLRKGIKDTVLYDEKAVKERFGFSPDLLPDYKGLCGDASDNIVGVKGIGEKTASALISTFGSLENVYQALEKDEEKVKEKASVTNRVINLLKEGKDEAMFSKMLAEIRKDAPIQFTLPKKEWRASLDPKIVYETLEDLEFRSLADRISKSFGIEKPEETESEEEIDPKELKKAAVMLWLVDSNYTNPSKEDVFTYTRAKTFSDAKTVLEKELKEKDLVSVYENIELPLMPVIEKMEKRGIKLDLSYVEKLRKEYRGELEELEKKIYKHAGKEFNINSPRQLGDILFDTLELKKSKIKKTATGARSTQESELQKLRDEHPIIADILEYRELQKLLSTYIDVLPDMVGEDGRLHASFLQSGSTTGRMASQNPNLQNIPIRTERGQRIRNAFIAEEGFLLASLDYSQIEIRIAAMLSRDEKLLDFFKRGEDIHRAVAAEVFHIPPEKVSANERAKAKVINFGILYGMGINALRQNLGEGVSREEAAEFYKKYTESFPTLMKFLQKTVGEARKKGYTTTYFGRRRYFADINSKLPYIRSAAERMALNAPIQGTEADVIKLAMIKINDYLEKKKLDTSAYLLLQVHDELVYEVEELKARELAGKFKEIMESIITPIETGGITLAAEASIGKNWGKNEMEEL